MLLTEFVRDRSDVELERLANAVEWRSGKPLLRDGCGCLIAHAFACGHPHEYLLWSVVHDEVENFYMDLATDNGEAETGALISRLARRELGRRAMAAIGELAVPESVEVGR